MHQIHLISPPNLDENELIEKILTVHKQTSFIHIRQKAWTKQKVASCINKLINQGVSRTKIIVNTYADIAYEKQLAGVHLPEKGPSISDLKKQYPSLTIGVSVHSLQSAKEKSAAGADYVIFGHVFQTQSKQDLAPKGIQALQKVTRHLSIPVIAIGGIQPANMCEVKAAGAMGIAVLSYVLLAENPKQALMELLAKEGCN